MDSIHQALQHWNVLEETSLQLVHTSSNDIRNVNKGNHQPSKEQASSCVNKDGMKHAKHYISEQKNILVREKTMVTNVTESIKTEVDLAMAHQQNMR